ncbi:MAG: alpha-E domain-containing protein [Betaproteobacteria bacterium]|nr:alpha-E domain-containing protein [Betaproteobacteria bacterium]MBV9360163.1 alpha-E domain-containing protein [Betaproteobacteria bacterium]
MLSRVAERVFWMSRQMERAESMARILGVTSNLVLFGTEEVQEQNLLAPLAITGTEELFAEHHAKLTLAGLIDFLALDESNPSSIYCCLKLARENAHAVRWQITSEMWETLNATWLELRAMPRKRITGAGATEFLDWVKERSHLFRGVTYGTIVRGEAFNFCRLGTFLERADNTARILDVKYHILLPSAAAVGGALDYYQWAALLRSVSSFETYRQLYREQIFPIRVAQLLILERRMPRSLAACFDQVKEAMDRIRGEKDEAAKRLAYELHARLSYADIEEVFQGGLHEYLTEVLADIGKLGSRVERAYLGVV